MITQAFVAALLAFSTIAPGAEPPATSPQKAAAKASVYDEAADGAAQISAAVAKARREHKRVLVQWGGNWCPWCIRLHELYAKDAKVAHELLYEYVTVMVDTGRPAGKNMELAASYGADVAKHGFPYLTILDAEGTTAKGLPGKPIANQETEALEVKKADGTSAGVKEGHDPAAVLELLVKHQSPRVQASAVLADGVARAKAGGKRVFVHFGAPWCVWCRRLEAWMAEPAVRELLERDLVDVAIDVDRMEGGATLKDDLGGAKAGGIPWFVILDGAGKPIITSDGPGGNIGFPSAPEEIEHFGAMLRKGQSHLDEAAVKAILDSLKARPVSGSR